MIDILPPELVAYIFILATQSRHFHGQCRTYSPVPDRLTRIAFPGRVDLDYRPPWILGQVCSKWRAIARSEPLLWRDFMLTTEDIDAMQAISSAEERIPFGLKSIKLRLVDPTLESGIQSFIPTLTLTFTNLRRVYLLARLEPLVEILEALPQTLPHLQDLGLQVIGTPHKFADDLCDRLQRIQLARIANNMRQLQLCVDPFPFLASQLLRSLFPCIQWSKLSYLVIIGLRIEREDISCIDYFLEILSHCASLESLSCHLFEGVHELPLPKPEADNVLRLPHLKSLSVAHWQPSLLFPWAQLKELTLDSTLLSYALWILKQTPHLELLSIDIYNRCSLEFFRRGCPQVTLTSLHSLTLQCSDLLFLNYLIAPTLTTLRIKGSQFPTSADAGVLEVQEVQDFIRCSKASLHAFYYEVQVKPLTEKKYRSLSSLLKTLPSLQEFCAPHVVFSENILHNFILKKKWFLPNLQAVEFNVQSPAMFAQFIEERVNKGIEEKGFVCLKEGYGCYYPSSWPGYDGIVKNATERLQALNRRYGTDFRLVKIQETTV